MYLLSVCLSIYLSVCLSVCLLSVYLSICLSDWTIYLSVCVSVYLCIYTMYLSILLSIHLYGYLSIWLPVYQTIWLFIYLSLFFFLRTLVGLFISLSIYLSILLSESKQLCETSVKKWKLICPKRSNSAKLPQKLYFLSSKTKNFRRDVFNFKFDNTKQFCENSFKNGKLNAELTAAYQCVLRFFHSICLKYCACHENVRPGHTKCCACHAKLSSQTWRSDALKGNPFRKSAPGPPNMSDGYASCTAPATRRVSLQILFQRPTPAIVFGSARTFGSLFTRCRIHCACHAKLRPNLN